MPKKKLSQSSIGTWIAGSKIFREEHRFHLITVCFFILLLIAAVFAIKAGESTLQRVRAEYCPVATGTSCFKLSSPVNGSWWLVMLCKNNVQEYFDYCLGTCGNTNSLSQSNYFYADWQYGKTIPMCSAAASTTTTIPPCRTVTQGNGTYCGGNQNGDGAGGHSGWLYDCQNNQTVGEVFGCTNGCQHNSWSGDFCKYNPVSSDPCYNVKQGNGAYCGSNQSQDGAGGAEGWLYDCENNRTASRKSCDITKYGPGYACVHSTSGPDYCR